MTEFISLLKTIVICGTVFFIAFIGALALPQSKLRSVVLETVKWLVTAALLLLTISPIDVVPDVVPVLGWVDDLGYIVGGVMAARSAWQEHQKRALMQD
ncbi:MAG: DUF1232 domain-containing protein [Phycisphaerales bacterium]